MPSRNQIKQHDAVDQLFHVYNRGVDRRAIFRSQVDRREFLQSFRRYLCPDSERDVYRRAYRKLNDQVAVVAFCLMPNHFHLILRQLQAGGMARLMRSATSGYVMSYNRRHQRSGRIFESPYKARPLFGALQAMTAISYVHNNHSEGPDYELCSHGLYLGRESSDWVDVESGLDVFGGKAGYESFLDGYIARTSGLIVPDSQSSE